MIRADVILKNNSSLECRHIFCATCLISWWQASTETSCPACRRVSTRIPIRDHSHETLIDAIRATSGQEVEQERLGRRVFEKFFWEQDVDEMDVDDTDSQSTEGEQPIETIDLTGDDGQ